MEDELLTQLQELLATPQLELVARGGGIVGEDGVGIHQPHYVLISRELLAQVLERLTTTATGAPH